MPAACQSRPHQLSLAVTPPQDDAHTVSQHLDAEPCKAPLQSGSLQDSVNLGPRRRKVRAVGRPCRGTCGSDANRTCHPSLTQQPSHMGLPCMHKGPSRLCFVYTRAPRAASACASSGVVARLLAAVRRQQTVHHSGKVKARRLHLFPTFLQAQRSVPPLVNLQQPTSATHLLLCPALGSMALPCHLNARLPTAAPHAANSGPPTPYTPHAGPNTAANPL